ncbi:MAG: hypothetical protein AAFO89_15020 [Planctomycetota bacterium]
MSDPDFRDDLRKQVAQWIGNDFFEAADILSAVVYVVQLRGMTEVDHAAITYKLASDWHHTGLVEVGRAVQVRHHLEFEATESASQAFASRVAQAIEERWRGPRLGEWEVMVFTDLGLKRLEIEN